MKIPQVLVQLCLHGQFLSLLMTGIVTASYYQDLYKQDNWTNQTIGPFSFIRKPLAVTTIQDNKICTHGQKGVERKSNLSLNIFWDQFDGKRPVIITDIIPQWKAFKLWNKDFFQQNYGGSRVAVKLVQEGLMSGQSSDMTSFITSLDDNFCQESWKYLEDEIFLLDKPTLQQHIGNNYILKENYFELFPEEIRPWDCMMLWGTKYSRSTLHMDPYNWTAISAVIWGEKHWKLFPPGQDQFLYIHPSLKCGFPLECNKYDSPIDTFDPDYTKYPEFQKAVYIEVKQQRGELLVIPTGWYHQAYNDKETFSISTQLMNRNNADVILEEILKAGNLDRQQLPPDLGQLTASEQVKAFISLLPEKILKNGKEVNERVLENLKNAIG